MEIIGTQGHIVQDGLRTPDLAILAAGAEGWVFERGAGPDFSSPPAPGPVAYLIRCIEGDREPDVTIEDARATFGVAMAAYESAQTGQPARPA
jgi:predicted dehydrogenase